MPDKPYPGMSALLDPARDPNGRLRKGFRPPEGKKKKKRGPNFKTALKRAMNEDDPKMMRVAIRIAAETVGCKMAEVPMSVRGSVQELTAWVASMRAVGGNIDYFREFGDRLDPKPKRVEISGPDGTPVRTITAVSKDAPVSDQVSAYFQQLDATIDDAE